MKTYPPWTLDGVACDKCGNHPGNPEPCVNGAHAYVVVEAVEPEPITERSARTLGANADTIPDVEVESVAAPAPVAPRRRPLVFGVALLCLGMLGMTYAVASVGVSALIVLAGGIVYAAGVVSVARAWE